VLQKDLLIGKDIVACEGHHEDRILPVGSELSVKLQIEGHELVLSVEDQEFTWNIPTHTEPNIIQRPEAMGGSKSLDDYFASKLWFRNRYGMVGFRAYGLEKAIITDLIVWGL
jgi:hypothetical protein